MTARRQDTATDVTVIVPTLGGHVLQGCLESIAGGTRLPARLVVVNQGSTVPAESWIAAMRDRGMDVLHLLSLRPGSLAATNLGLRAGSHAVCRRHAR